MEAARDVSLLSQGTPPLTELTSLWESAPAEETQLNVTDQLPASAAAVVKLYHRIIIGPVGQITFYVLCCHPGQSPQTLMETLLIPTALDSILMLLADKDISY